MWLQNSGPNSMAIGLKLQFSWARTETPRGLKMWAPPQKKMPSSMSEVEFLVTNPRFSLQWILDMLGAQSWCFFRDHDLGLACRFNRVGCFWEFLTKNKQLYTFFFAGSTPFYLNCLVVIEPTLTFMRKDCRGIKVCKVCKSPSFVGNVKEIAPFSWPMYRVWNVVV